MNVFTHLADTRKEIIDSHKILNTGGKYIVKRFIFVGLYLLLFIPFSVSAQIVKQIDTFDNTTHVFSYFRDIEAPLLKPYDQVILKKTYKGSDEPEYLLILNRKDHYSGVKDYSFYNDFYIKFNGDTNDVYVLPKKGLLGNRLLGEHVALVVPKNVVDKIRTANKIEVKIPTHVNIAKEVTLESNILSIPEEVIKEWKMLIIDRM
jgi:hypothetical protein